jgi:hypothetical protein
MHVTVSQTVQAPGFRSHERRLAALGVLIVACIVSTGVHYTHNYLQIEHYPQSDLFSNSTVKLAILIAWPLLTAIGVFAYVLYARRRYVAAYPFLAMYSLLGIVTPGHFTGGSPHIPPFWYATIFTDALLGLAILAFAHWSAVTAHHVAPHRDAAV